MREQEGAMRGKKDEEEEEEDEDDVSYTHLTLPTKAEV